MLRRRILSIGAICMMAVLASCSSETNPVAPLASPPEETGDGFLTIRTTAVASRSAMQVGITATVENHTDRVFYARLRDPFGSPPPPALPTLFGVAGSSAFVEQWDPPSWQSLPLAIGDEGVWVVEILPHSTYTLAAYTYRPAPKDRSIPAQDRDRILIPSQNSLRLRVQYFDDAALSPDKAHQDFSNIFVVTRPRTP